MDRFKAAFAALTTAAVITSILAGFALLAPSATSGTATYSSSTEVATASSTSSASQNEVAVYGGSGGVTNTSGSLSSSQTAVTSTETTVSGASISTGPPATTVSSTVTSAASTVTITATTTATYAQTIVTIAGATTTVPGSTTQASSQPLAIATSTSTVVATGTNTTASSGPGSSGLFGLLGVSRGESPLDEVKTASIVLAPVCWILLGGAWVWRGRVRARYSELGFGSDVFELFMKMKGGATRVKVLNTLTSPKDRLQLADELGVDWKTVDRHVQILNKYGFVREQSAYGTIRLYELTPLGKMLLDLFDDLSKTNGPVPRSSADESPESRPAS